MLAFILIWLFGGVCGYVMMYSCDKTTGAKLCNGNFFVLDGTANPFITALIFAPVAFVVGIIALVYRKKYTGYHF